MGHPHPPRRAEGRRPAAVDQGHDGEADARRPREARRDPAGRRASSRRRSSRRRARSSRRSCKAEGQKQAAILAAEGQAKAIETVFKAIHDGNPDPQLLAYQYLQVLPQIAQGDANKVWVIPSELTRALGGISRAHAPPSGGRRRYNVRDAAADGPCSSRPAQRLLNSSSSSAALVVSALVVRHFAARGLAAAPRERLARRAGRASIMLAAYAAKAWGWQRLFRRGQRPAVLTLAAAGGAASVGGIALPGRCDDVIRVAVVRRCRRRRASIERGRALALRARAARQRGAGAARVGRVGVRGRRAAGSQRAGRRRGRGRAGRGASSSSCRGSRGIGVLCALPARRLGRRQRCLAA